jgi:Membrane-associated lipoprotein involved in thiamine biosynthesis
MRQCSLVFLVFLFLFSGCKAEEWQYYADLGAIFHTKYSIKYKYKKPLTDEIQKRLQEYDLSMNPFNNNSIIYKVNNNIDVKVDQWFTDVFNKAKEASDVSGGTYDITAAPLINLWGFGYEEPGSISQETIDSLKQFVGYQKIRLEGGKALKDDPRVQLNTSSIAKGHSCDVVAELLESYGIKDYMIEIGGEVRAKGKNPKGICWRIQLSDPTKEENLSNKGIGILELCDYAVATSGNYRNYREIKGKKYGHTIDPISGYPIETDIISASVLYPDCMTADAFATVFMTQGLKKSLAIVAQYPKMKYVFVYVDRESGEVKIATNTQLQ